MLPRHLYRYEIHIDRILDLTDTGILEQLGISQTELIGEDLSVTRSLGEGAHALGLQAIRSASAAGRDQVLAFFIENIGSGVINPELAEVWSSLEDVEKTGSR